MNQTGLPLLDYGERLKREGMALAECAQELASPGSNQFAFDEIVRIARMQDEVHADDLRHVKLQHANAWGSVWLKAIKSGIIERTGRIRPCVDPAKHKHNSPVYRSLIVGRR